MIVEVKENAIEINFESPQEVANLLGVVERGTAKYAALSKSMADLKSGIINMDYNYERGGL